MKELSEHEETKKSGKAAGQLEQIVMLNRFNKFIKFQAVKHKNGGIYMITTIPDSRKLEHCNESFYEYQDMLGHQVWIRCKSEMEDGRFTPIN